MEAVVGGIRITPKDKAFADEVKKRDDYTCQRCGTYKGPKHRGLDCAHYITRRTQATRLDFANALALCYGCHQYVDSHPEEKEKLWRERMGDRSFNALMLRADRKEKARSELLEFGPPVKEESAGRVRVKTVSPDEEWGP